jgi:hypothetical protein
MNEGKFTLGEINTEDTIEQIWNKVKTDILESAETVLGHLSRKHIRQWFDEDSWHATQKKIKPIESSWNDQPE